MYQIIKTRQDKGFQLILQVFTRISVLCRNGKVAKDKSEEVTSLIQQQAVETPSPAQHRTEEIASYIQQQTEEITSLNHHSKINNRS